MSRFLTEDQSNAWVKWIDERSVERVGPQGDITFRSLLWRRSRQLDFSSAVHSGGGRAKAVAAAVENAWLNMRCGSGGSPADLYAACRDGRIIAWGRFRGGRLESIPLAEWATGRPKGWTDICFDEAELQREFPPATAPEQDRCAALGPPPGQETEDEPNGCIAEPQMDKVQCLAEWIFERYDRERRWRKLYKEALEDGALGEFKKNDLLAAFRHVYVTKKHAPTATGWPLQEPYKSRLGAMESFRKSH